MLARRCAQFARWAKVTAVAYLLMVLFVLAVGLLGPQAAALRAAPSPIPDASPTVTTPRPTAMPPPVIGTPSTMPR